jgi:hypothetical protein
MYACIAPRARSQRDGARLDVPGGRREAERFGLSLATALEGSSGLVSCMLHRMTGT